MKRTTKKSTPVEYLTQGQAAEVAGMSRIAFMAHVKAGNICPDSWVGKRGVFSRALVESWCDERAKSGLKKPGPKPRDVEVTV